jgi:hypothetical protein
MTDYRQKIEFAYFLSPDADVRERVETALAER